MGCLDTSRGTVGIRQETAERQEENQEPDTIQEEGIKEEVKLKDLKDGTLVEAAKAKALANLAKVAKVHATAAGTAVVPTSPAVTNAQPERAKLEASILQTQTPTGVKL